MCVCVCVCGLHSQYPSFLQPRKPVQGKSLLSFMQPGKPGCVPCTLKFARVASLIDVICPGPGRWRALLCMKWMPDTPPPSITPPPLPDTRGKGVSFILWSAGCCLCDASHSTYAFSDGNFFNALADEDFDLLQLTEEERAELVAVVNQEGNDTTHTTGNSISHI